jgi:hypothetical protein
MGMHAGEIVVGPCKTLMMDEISTGLDSSTTHQIVRCIKHMVHQRKVGKGPPCVPFRQSSSMAAHVLGACMSCSSPWPHAWLFMGAQGGVVNACMAPLLPWTLAWHSLESICRFEA